MFAVLRRQRAVPGYAGAGTDSSDHARGYAGGPRREARELGAAGRSGVEAKLLRIRASSIGVARRWASAEGSGAAAGQGADPAGAERGAACLCARDTRVTP